MRQNIFSINDLKVELQEWRENYPALNDDELFVAWFLRAFVVDNNDQAVNALTGGSGDKDADAVVFDDRAKTVFIIQGKYRKAIGGTKESRKDVKSFADLATDLLGEDELFKNRLRATNPKVRQALHEARERLSERKYQLQLYYVTLGGVSKSIEAEAHSSVRRNNGKARIDIIDGHATLLLLSDYLDGVAPPIPTLDLKMESGSGISCSGLFNRKDNQTGIQSWIFSMSSLSIAEIFERSGTRLFARNVRGFLGDTEINSSMKATLEKAPQNFWYYNNGITIVCDAAQPLPIDGQTVLRVTNPQIINGQQTTRILHQYGKDARGASTIVRVFLVPRQQTDDSSHFDSLVTHIVQATNWQNAIRPSDLMSNDRRQIEIERKLRKLNYLYIRKRQSKGEAHQAAATACTFSVKKDELAQVVAACDLDPALVREGKEKLFEERWYSSVFPNSNPHFYLCRYWLLREVNYVSRGYPERAYAKWLVINFVWSHLQKQLLSRSQQMTFYKENETWSSTSKSLLKVIEVVFRAVLDFYRQNRGKGEKAIDVSSFFHRVRLHIRFKNYWTSSSNKHRTRFKRAWKNYISNFDKAIKA